MRACREVFWVDDGTLFVSLLGFLVRYRLWLLDDLPGGTLQKQHIPMQHNGTGSGLSLLRVDHCFRQRVRSRRSQIQQERIESV